MPQLLTTLAIAMAISLGLAAYTESVTIRCEDPRPVSAQLKDQLQGARY